MGYISIATTATGTQFSIGRSSPASSATVTWSQVLPNAWTYVALTVDGTTLRAYVNGTQVGQASTTLTPALIPLEQRNFIGASALGGVSQFFGGQIGQVAYYSHVLTAARVSAHYAAVAPPPSAPTNTAVPTISPAAVVGQTVNVGTGAWTGTPTPYTYAYQWQTCAPSGANCAVIPGATTASYQVPSGTAGSSVRVVVTASNSQGFGTATSAAAPVYATGYAPSVLADAPWMYWRANEAAASTTAADSSGSGVPLTYGSGATLGASGPVVGDDTAASLLGVGGPVLSGTTGGPGASFAAEAWVRIPTASTAGGSLFSWAGSASITVGSNGGVATSVNTSSGGCASNPSISAPAGSIAPGSWALVDWVYDSINGETLFVNGQLLASGAAAGTPCAHSSTTQWGVGFTGDVAELAVYSYPLSATRIVAHYAASGQCGCSVIYPTLYGLYGDYQASAPTTSGTTGASFSVAPALPAGLSLNAGTGAISGTPSFSGPAPPAANVSTYTVTTTTATGASTSQVALHLIPASAWYSETVKADAPLDFWQFNDAPGSAAAADSTGAAPLTYTSTTLGVPGPIAPATAASFNGSGSAIANGLSTAGTQTVEAWVLPPSLADETVLQWGNESWMLRADGSMSFSAILNGNFCSNLYSRRLPAATVTPGQWQQVDWVLDFGAAQDRVYVNGQRVFTGSVYGGSSTCDANHYIS